MTDTERQSAEPDHHAHHATDTSSSGQPDGSGGSDGSPRPTPLQIARIAARSGDERKAADIRLLDVTASSSITDYFVIMTGFNRRQIQSIAWELDREMKHLGVTKLGMEGYETAWWVLVDYGSVLVHIFHADAREYYDIDMLQGDAVEIDWTTDDLPPSAAGEVDHSGEEPPHGNEPVTADYEPAEKPEDARDSGVRPEDLAGIDIDSLTPIEQDDEHDEAGEHGDDDESEHGRG